MAQNTFPVNFLEKLTVVINSQYSVALSVILPHGGELADKGAHIIRLFSTAYKKDVRIIKLITGKRSQRHCPDARQHTKAIPGGLTVAFLRLLNQPYLLHPSPIPLH